MRSNSSVTEVRPGAPEDLNEILAVYFAGSGRRPAESLVKECLSNHPSVVALEHTRIVGFVFCRRFAADIIEIANLFVDEQYRSRGVGTALIARLEEDVRGHCHSLIVSNSMLVVGIPNKRPADKFYRDRGYQEIWNTGSTFVFCKKIAPEAS